MSHPDLLPRGADPLDAAAFVASRAGRVVAYLDELTAPDRALIAAAGAFADLGRRPDGRAPAGGGGAEPGDRARGDDATPDDDALLAATRAAASRVVAGRLAGRADDGAFDGVGPGLEAALTRAEAGFRDRREVPLDGVEIGVLTTALLLGVPAAAATGTEATSPPRARRTSVPEPPAAASVPAPRAAGADHAPGSDTVPGGPARGRTILGARRTLSVGPRPAGTETVGDPTDVLRSPSANGTASGGGGESPHAGADDDTRRSSGPGAVLRSPVVRQLAVPTGLLLAVVLAVLVAIGAFGGGDEPRPPVTTPGLPTVPGDPRAIPPLP